MSGRCVSGMAWRPRTCICCNNAPSTADIGAPLAGRISGLGEATPVTSHDESKAVSQSRSSQDSKPTRAHGCRPQTGTVSLGAVRRKPRRRQRILEPPRRDRHQGQSLGCAICAGELHPATVNNAADRDINMITATG